MQLAVINGLVVEAADFNLRQLGQFAGQIFDMDTRATVDVGGIFVGRQQNAHWLLYSLGRVCGDEWGGLR